jgi:hypothetical protein
LWVVSCQLSVVSCELRIRCLKRNVHVGFVGVQQVGELVGEDEVVFGEFHAAEILINVDEHQFNLGDWLSGGAVA